MFRDTAIRSTPDCFLFMIWKMNVTMRTAMFPALLAAGMTVLGSCSSGNYSPVEKVDELVLRPSTLVIESDGADAVHFEVLADGIPVTEGVSLYDGTSGRLLDLPEMSFSADVPGTYYFRAVYRSAESEIVGITAVDFDLPEMPADPSPESTSFRRRILLTQFTGTGCGYCPGMVTILRNVLDDVEYSSKVVLSAAHTYNSSDPAYLSQRLDQAMGVSGYPAVVADMYLGYANYNVESGLRHVIDEAYDRSRAKAGIAVATRCEGNTAVVLVSVKAAESSEFRVGAWMLEDGVYGPQLNYNPGYWTGDYNIHDNCIRYADSRVSNIDYSGFSVGTLDAGQETKYVFTIDLDDKWVKENCHVAVFVTTPDAESEYTVNNVVDVPLGGSANYEYAE